MADRRMILLFIPLMVVVTKAQTEIKVDCGKLEVQGYNSCEINHKDEIISFTGPEKQVFPDIRLGLITYKCDHEAGYFMSDIDCEKCTTQCTEEYPEPTCPSDPTQFWAGLVLGVCLYILVTALIIQRLKRSLDRSNANSETIRNTTTTSHKDEAFLNVRSRGSEDIDWDRTRDYALEDANATKRPKKAPKKTLKSMVLGLLLFGSSEACSVVVTMDANNVTMFCQNSVCGAMPAFFGVRKGHEICVEDHFGEKVTVEVSEIVWRIRYELAYYTANYTIEVHSAGACCDQKEYRSCVDKSCYKQAVSYLLMKGRNESAITGECNYTPSYKEALCAHHQIYKKTGDLYGVLRKTAELAIVTLKLKELNSTHKTVLSAQDPTWVFESNQLKNGGTGQLQFTILPSFSGTPRSYSLLQFADSFYHVHSSAKDEPDERSYGDFQVALNQRDVKYARPRIFCDVTGECDCTCNAVAKSMMNSSFLNQENKFKQPEHFVVRKPDFSVIDTFETVSTGEVRMRIGVLETRDFEQMDGRCEVGVLGTYSCSSCEERSYIVLNASSITNPGLVPFRSNCSFDRDFIKCDFDPTKLTLLRPTSATCYIRLPTLGKQLIVHAHNFKLGHRLGPRHHLNCTKFATFGEALGDLVTSTTFVVTSAATMVVLSLLSFLVVIVLRHVHNRGERYTVENDDDLVEL